jgi:hypothetical protein
MMLSSQFAICHDLTCSSASRNQTCLHQPSPAVRKSNNEVRLTCRRQVQLWIIAVPGGSKPPSGGEANSHLLQIQTAGVVAPKLTRPDREQCGPTDPVSCPT